MRGGPENYAAERELRSPVDSHLLCLHVWQRPILLRGCATHSSQNHRRGQQYNVPATGVPSA